MGRVINLRFGAIATRMEQHFETRGAGRTVVGLDDKTLCTGDRSAVGRERSCRETVLRKVLRPPREHLPRSDGVKFLSIVEQQYAEVTRIRRSSHL
jgi:hypothetical protein